MFRSTFWLPTIAALALLSASAQLQGAPSGGLVGMVGMGPDGKYYMIRVDTSGIVQTNGAANSGGGIAASYQGAYNSATSYSLNSVVTYNGSSYVALQASSNGNPQTPGSAPTYWGLLALVGSAGANGSDAVTGSYAFNSFPTTLAADKLIMQTDAAPGSTCTAGGGAMRRICRSKGANAGFEPADAFGLEKNVANGIIGLGGVVPTLGTPASYNALGQPFQVGNYNQLFCGGDSYVAGLALARKQNAFCGLLAGDVPAPRVGFTDIAVSGTTTPTIVDSLFRNFSTDPARPAVIVVDGNTNDANYDTSSPTSATSPSVQNFYNLAVSDTLWNSLQYQASSGYAQKVMASKFTATSGTWTSYTSASNVPANAANGNQGYEVYNSTAGNVLSYSMSTPTTATALVLFYRQVNGATGTFNVTVDSAAINERYGGTTAWSKGPAGGQAFFQTSNGQARVAQIIPVTASSASHTIAITNGDSTNLYITGVAYLVPTPEANSNVIAYLNGAANAGWSSSTVLGYYNTALATVVSALAGYGQTQIMMVDQNSPVTYAGVTYPALSSSDYGTTASCPSATSNHPNCTGSLKLRDLFLYTLASKGYPVGFYGGGDAAAPEPFYQSYVTSLASASTIAPASGVVHVTGTTAINTIAPMQYCQPGGADQIRCGTGVRGEGVECRLRLPFDPGKHFTRMREQDS